MMQPRIAPRNVTILLLDGLEIDTRSHEKDVRGLSFYSTIYFYVAYHGGWPRYHRYETWVCLLDPLH